MDSEYLKKLVIARLKTIPPSVSFSIGPGGNFTRNQVIDEIMRESEVGKEIVEMEIKLLLKTPKLVNWLHSKSDPKATA